MEGSKLSEEQIFECLKSLNVPVRMDDLKFPSREFIIRVFESFLKDLQIDITSQLRSWEVTNHIEEAEIYEDIMEVILLAMSVNHITNACGLHITIKDIVEPRPKRTKKILNYMIVFWNYYLRKYSCYRTIEATFEEEKMKAEAIVKQNVFLDEKYDDLKKILKNMPRSEEELAGSVAALKEIESKLNLQSESIVADYEGLKTKKAKLLSDIGATNVQILTAKERLDELGQLILSSPERIKTEIQKFQEKIKSEDMKIKELENICKDAEKKLQLQEESKEEEKKHLATLNNLIEEIEHLRETVKNIVNINQKTDEESDKVKRLQLDVDRKEDAKLNREQKCTKVVLNSKKQKETLLEVLKLSLNEETREKKAIDSIKAVINEAQENIDFVSDEILKVISKCKEADARSVERKTQYMSQMTEVKTTFESDCKEVTDAIKKKFPY